jgi:hypothetical protein
MQTQPRGGAGTHSPRVYCDLLRQPRIWQPRACAKAPAADPSAHVSGMWRWVMPRLHAGLLRDWVLVGFVLAVTPASAAPIYELKGLLAWDATSGPDRLSLSGLALVTTFEITSSTPTNLSDPNGTQSQYVGVATLNLGGVPVGITSALASFFHASDPSTLDVANWVLTPSSSGPAFYYPAVNLPPGTNANAASRPPIYPTGVGTAAFFLVPGLDPTVPADNAVYRILDFSFPADGATPVPEPSALLLTGIGICLAMSRVASRRRHK